MLDSILRFDNLLYDSINRGMYNDSVFWFFGAITNVADLILVGLLLYFTYLLVVGRAKSSGSKTILMVLVSVVIAETITLAGKLLIPRAEPTPYVQLFTEYWFVPIGYALYSFPSGHTSRVFAMATVLGEKYTRWRIPLFIFASLIGFSRIYIGAHYPLDVVAGALLGIIISLIVLRVFRFKGGALDEKK